MEKQTWPTKQLDGTVTERHVYSGPLGDGFIDRVWRDNAGVLELKATHTGPENIESFDFKPIPETQKKNPIRFVLEDRGEWKEGKQTLKDQVVVDLKGIDGTKTKSKVIKVPYIVNGKEYTREFELHEGENKIDFNVTAEDGDFKSDPVPAAFTITYIAPKEDKALDGAGAK